MYAKDTILELKEQKPADEETGEPFPYNEVRVVGESPVSHSDKGNFTGPEAAGVILVPISNFGATLDEPFGKCQMLYNVKEIPEVEVVTERKVRVVDAQSAQAGPTPEEVFKEQAPGDPDKKGLRSRKSPLGEVTNPEKDGPLGKVKPEPVEEPKPKSSPLD